MRCNLHLLEEAETDSLVLPILSTVTVASATRVRLGFLPGLVVWLGGLQRQLLAAFVALLTPYGEDSGPLCILCNSSVAYTTGTGTRLAHS